MRNSMLTVGAWAVALIAAVPLVSVLYMLIVHGGSRLVARPVHRAAAGRASRWAAASATQSSAPSSWWRSPRVISVPIGILAAVYLAELGPDSQLGRVSRVPRQGPDRLPVDPGRRLRLRGDRAGHGHLLGHRRRRRARHPDAADGDADRRGGHEDGAAQDEGRGPRHGLHPHPDDLEGRVADRAARAS